MMLDAHVTVVLEAAPGFVPRYLDLVEAADGDPGMAVTFTELADYVAELVTEVERCTPVLARCLEGVEAVASSSEDGVGDRGVGVPRQPVPRRPPAPRPLARPVHPRPAARGRSRSGHLVSRSWALRGDGRYPVAVTGPNAARSAAGRSHFPDPSVRTETYTVLASTTTRSPDTTANRSVNDVCPRRDTVTSTAAASP